jgi:ABC-2 type transport system permease protein
MIQGNPPPASTLDDGFGTLNRAGPPSAIRAWLNLIRVSWQRQARAHLLVWIALGLLALTVFIVLLNTQLGRWNTSYWRSPRGRGPSYAEFLFPIEVMGYLPSGAAGHAVHQAVWGSLRQVMFDSSGFFVFSNGIVFTVFTTFLLPLWCLCFATEGLGREREARNLIWLLTRPLPRWAMYLAKWVALLPWALALGLGGFALICAAAPGPGGLAFRLYWPAVLWGTLAFCALFHLMGALARRPAVVAILYAFFLETVAGNLPGHMKRLSLSFYTRCLMFERAEEFGIRPARPHIYLPVDGPTAMSVLIAVTLLALILGMWVFSRREYLDTSG